MNKTNFLNALAYHTLDLLTIKNALLYEDETAFYVWPRADRAIIVFDPATIKLNLVNDAFAHDLSTRLHGPLVVRTNTRGLFIQVDYNIRPALMDLTEKPLNLDEQPSLFHMPVGHTQKKDLWISLTEGDSFLIGGSRGLGKTGIEHGWIQALLHGNQTQIYGWDGKDGIEFLRYADHKNFHLLHNLNAGLREIMQEANKRKQILIQSGHPNIISFNAGADKPIQPIALFVDEAKLVPDEARPLLVEIVERLRNVGIYPVLATNNPEQASLLVKTNLVTRICLPVPSWNASQMVLGGKGARADQLPKVRGRGLVEWGGRIVEFQAFRVTYPDPSTSALSKFGAVLKAQDEAEPEPTVDAETMRIIECASQGKSSNAIIRELWNVTGGGNYLRRQEQVKAVLDSKNVLLPTSTSFQMPEIGLEGTV